MTLPFDPSPPETRPVPITFYTTETVEGWLNGLMAETNLDRSLIVHRILDQARSSTPDGESERRVVADRRSA